MGNFDDLFNFTVEEALGATRIRCPWYDVDLRTLLWDTKYRQFKKDELLNMTVAEFWEKYSEEYDNGTIDCYEAIGIPVYDMLEYFNEGLDREMVYCSVFRNFALAKNKSWFKIIGLDNNWVMWKYVKDKFNCKGNITMGEMLNILYEAVREMHIDFFKDYDHCNEGDKDLCVERKVMFEFIIRNAEKYDIEYHYESVEEMYIYSIGKRWI